METGIIVNLKVRDLDWRKTPSKTLVKLKMIFADSILEVLTVLVVCYK